MELREEIVQALGTCEGIIETAKTVRSKDRRMSNYVEALRQLVPKVHLRRYRGEPYVYNGMWWERVTWKAVGSAMYEALMDVGVMAVDAIRVPRYTYPSIPEFVPEMRLLAFTNCLYDCNTFTAGDFSDERYCVRGLGYEYRPAARGRWFANFLKEVLPDWHDRKAVQEFFGSCFVNRDRLSLEKFLLMIGEGANGKSVLIRAVTAAIGPGMVSHLDPRQLCDDRMVEGLRDKVLNVASDVKTEAELSSGLKPLVSAEEVEGWELYKGRVTVKAPPLAFSMNHIPRTSDMSEGMLRRMLPVVFSVTIPPERRDAALADKIIARDLPAVFNWMIMGARGLIHRGGRFTVPSRSRRMVEEITKASYPVLEMMEKEGLFPKPRWKGQRPELMKAREVQSLLGLDCTAQEMSVNMRNAGFKVVERGGYRLFQMYRDS